MSLSRYKKAELKDMLLRLDLDSEGLKPDLEQRLQNYLESTGRELDELEPLSDLFVEDSSSDKSPRKSGKKSMAPETTKSERVARHQLVK